MSHFIIGTAGHIDHGKTSLIRMLTGIDCDTHKEEKQRGITINLGFSYLNLSGGESLGIIDVPGHKDFISTMIGGACGIDMVLLVIAADSGIMPQTTEHLNIISALGIRKGVVALTKSDLVDEELLEMATLEITEFLAGTELKDAPIIPVSSVTGQGRDELIQAITASAAGMEARETGGLFRMYVDRIFSVKGFGSVVTGSVMSGSLEAGQDVYLLPGEKQKLRIRSLERHGQAVGRVVAGDRAAINLIGLKKEDFERGMILCNKPLDAGNMIDASIQLFETGQEIPLWSNVLFITGTFECQARMHLLNKEKLTGDEDAIVQIHLSKPAVLMSKDKFIIRNTSEEKTLGGGYIIEASPLHHRKRKPALIDELSKLSTDIMSENSLREMIHAVIKKEFRPFTPEEIADRLHITREELMTEAEKPGSGFHLYRSDAITLLVHEPFDLSYRGRIIKAIREHHQKNPFFAEGLETGEIAGKLGLLKSPAGKAYPGFLLMGMETAGQLEKCNNTWIIKGHRPGFDKQSLAEIQWLEQVILDYRDNKPVITEIEEKAEEQKIRKHKIKTYLTWLTANGKIQFCKSDFIHTDILNQYRGLLLRHLADRKDGIDITDFKELIGGTKRFRALLVEFLEAEQLIRLVTGEENETSLYITPKGRGLLKNE